MAVRNGLYISSEEHHAPIWRGLRGRGMPLACSWVDGGRADIDARRIREANFCDAAMLYLGEGRGGPDATSLLETGAALGAGRPVIVVHSFKENPLKDGLLARHRSVTGVTSLTQALMRVCGLFDMVMVLPRDAELDEWEQATFRKAYGAGDLLTPVKRRGA